MAKRLNHSSWSSFGRSIVTWLLTNILYKRSSGMEPKHMCTYLRVQKGYNSFQFCIYSKTTQTKVNTHSPRPYKASLVLPFCRRMGLISILSTEWEWPKWFTSPEALSRSKAHKPSAWQKMDACSFTSLAEQQWPFSHDGGNSPQLGHHGYRVCWILELIYSGSRPDN